MKKLLLLGLFFLSSSWLYFIPLYEKPNFGLGFVFLILGLLINIIALKDNKSEHICKYYSLLIIPLILSTLIINFPYNLAPIVLSIGLIFLLMKNNCSQLFGKGFILSGVILSLQTAIFPFYSIFVSRGHRVDLLSPIVSIFANLFGLKTSVNNGVLFVQTLNNYFAFTTTYEKLGFFLWLNILVGFIIILFLINDKKKILTNIAIFLIISFFYILLRYVFMINFYLQTQKLDILWNPIIMSISFLPLSFLLIKIIDLKTNFKFKLTKPKKKQLISVFLIFIFVFFMVGAFTFHDPGIKKNGKILIDEYHSSWENTTEPLDKEWYGMLSTYNYYSWSEYLDKYYSVEKNINETISLELLKDYDILILKCPTSFYSNEEILSVISFVENGGGLYLIGDHTDVFGMNTFLNQISQNFGIEFKTDATYELGTGQLSKFTPDHLIVHPIMQKIKNFDFMTSCTLSAPLNSESVILGNRLISEPGTYSTENFFRESVSSTESEFGILLQSVALKYGKGRVVAFSDSTVFSSFSMFSDGFEKFALSTMDYLNRTNQYSYFNNVFIVISLLSLTIAICLVRKEQKLKILSLFVIFGLFSFSTSAPFFNFINENNYTIPKSHTDFTRVCFEQEHTNANISLRPGLSTFVKQNTYDTFYVWTQRLGLFPCLEYCLDSALDSDILVFINPVKSFSTQDFNLIDSYLKNGGKILVIDSINNTKSTSNELLESFGMKIQKNNSGTPYLFINGGHRFYEDKNNNSYANYLNIINKDTEEKGQIVVFVDSNIFLDESMGGVFVEPDDEQLDIFKTQFFLFEDALLKD